MPICVNLRKVARAFVCVVATSVVCVAFSAPQTESDRTLETGIKYFLKADYPSAKAMFEAVPSSSKSHWAIAAYYLGVIDARTGDNAKAYSEFADAIRGNSPAEIKNMSALAFAKLADANADYARINSVLSPLSADFSTSPLLDFYFEKAKLASDSKHTNAFSKRLASEFQSDDSVFADAFAASLASGDSVFKSIDLKKIPQTTPAARARLALIENPKVLLEKELADSSFFSQIVSGENGADIDAGKLEKRLVKYKDTDAAWRGALVLAKKYFQQKDYAKACESARVAEYLAAPEISKHWRALMIQGDCLRMLKDYDAARACYLKIAFDKKTLGEPQAESLYKTGLCWFDQKQWGKAHQYFERVFIAYFKFEYWGSRAYYYDATALLMMNRRRDAAATLLEYFKRANDRNSQIYKDARALYKEQYGSRWSK